MTDSSNSRDIVLTILTEVLEKGAYSHLVLRQALNKYQYMDKSERAFISRISEGTIEYLLQLDYVLNSFSSVKVSKMKPVIRNILRMSVYQILYMDRVPDSAVCNEAVKLAQKHKFAGLKGFVNGILRNIIRNKDTLSWPDDSVRYSMPSWLLDMWKEQLGEETLSAMLPAFLKTGATTVRCNLHRAEKQEIVDSLVSGGVTVEESAYSQSVLYLSKYDYLEGLEAFNKGWIQVQDLSSSLVGDVADPAEGSFVLDVCGAPGGKSLHVADLLHGTGTVEVRDLTESKVSLIEENIERNGFSNIRTKVWDALVPDEEMFEKADVVLADLPCSGLGIIGRKPDIKYRVKPEDLESLAALQRDMLSVVQSYVKPGGKLIFSTCTVNRKENEENAAWFLANHPFTAVNIAEKLDERLASPTMKQGIVQLLPGIHPCDGFFIAAFQKK